MSSAEKLEVCDATVINSAAKADQIKNSKLL